jgi:hypothetical protein
LLETVFFVWLMKSDYKEDSWGIEPVENWQSRKIESVECCVQLSSARKAKKSCRSSSVKGIVSRQFRKTISEGRTWAWEAEESPLLEVVARERLQKA